jgi:hypothetical protein
LSSYPRTGVAGPLFVGTAIVQNRFLITSEGEYPMKKTALALAPVLSGPGLVLGLASTDANAGARKICKQGLKTHPMAGEHRDLMKQCKAEYKAHKKAGHARAT